MTSLPSRDRVSSVSQFVHNPSLLQNWSLFILYSKFFVHRINDRCLPENFQKLSQAIWAFYLCVGGSHSASVPRSSLARVHREFVQHIVEDEVDGQEEKKDDRREDEQQREESGEREENQTHNMSA